MSLVWCSASVYELIKLEDLACFMLCALQLHYCNHRSCEYAPIHHVTIYHSLRLKLWELFIRRTQRSYWQKVTQKRLEIFLLVWQKVSLFSLCYLLLCICMFAALNLNKIRLFFNSFVRSLIPVQCYHLECVLLWYNELGCWIIIIILVMRVYCQ